MCALNDLDSTSPLLKRVDSRYWNGSMFNLNKDIPEFLNTFSECDQVLFHGLFTFNGSFQLKDTISEIINQDDTFMFSPVLDVPNWSANNGYNQKFI